MIEDLVDDFDLRDLLMTFSYICNSLPIFG